MEGSMSASSKMRVGYFTQYQVEELRGEDTPLQHMTRAMTGSTPGAVRAQLGRFGFSGDKATTHVAKLSGGERARLALALITREAPHLLILDEPTNHLDVDSREALVQALNGYDGAVIIVSHDRHMIELTADRLVLVEDGGAAEYGGSIDDYIDLVLGRNQSAAEAKAKQPKPDRKAAAKAREVARALKKAAAEAEAASARLMAQCSAIDRAMFDPESAPSELANLPVSELSRRREKIAAELEAAEARWIEASEQLERAAA
jgi:ATP-binding cassette, subfamily F, member 3